MPDQPYSARELETYFSDFKNDLQEIKAQTKLTNGRVTNLERWQSYVIGFCVCVSMFVIPLVVYAFFNR